MIFIKTRFLFIYTIIHKNTLQVEHLVYGLDSTFFLLHTSHLLLVLLNSNQWTPKFPNLTSEGVENNCLPLLGCKHCLPFEVPGDVPVFLFKPYLHCSSKL